MIHRWAIASKTKPEAQHTRSRFRCRDCGLVRCVAPLGKHGGDVDFWFLDGSPVTPIDLGVPQCPPTMAEKVPF